MTYYSGKCEIFSLRMSMICLSDQQWFWC